MIELLRRLEEYNQSHQCDTDMKTKEQRDFNAETDRIHTARARTASQQSLGFKIPVFHTQHGSGALRAVLRHAAKHIELQQRLELLDLWGNDVMQRLWTLLVENADRVSGTIDYPRYCATVEKFSNWAGEYYAGSPKKQSLFLDSICGNVAEPVFCNISLPKLDAVLFIQSPRRQNWRAIIRDLYALFLKRLSLYKVETELMLRDDDNDGCIRQDEMELYVEDLIPSLAVLANISQDFIPFYCCSTVRRIYWILDPCATGKIRIDKLLRHQVLDDWMEVQLALEDPPRNWFGFTISSGVHQKFLSLSQTESGMLTREEMHRYKKGIPTVVDDGLPSGVSPLTKLFIDRVFEVMPLFKGEMDYTCFVDFVLAVEFLPQCPRPSFFWQIFDLHNEGVLTPMIVNLFFRSVHEKLVLAGVSPPPLEHVVCEIFDLIPHKMPFQVTRDEFCSNSQVGLVCGILIDCLTFWTYENREQNMIQAMQAAQERGMDGNFPL